MRIVEFSDAISLTLEQAARLTAILEKYDEMDFWEVFGRADMPEDDPEGASE